MDNTVSIVAVKELRDAELERIEYAAHIAAMDKVELLEEMVRFQEERTRIGHLTPSLMIRGRELFSALEQNAETEELLILTRSYRRHLDYEMAEYRRSGIRQKA